MKLIVLVYSLFVFSIFCFSHSALSETVDVIERIEPVGIGETLPHNLELADQYGSMQSVKTIMGKQGAILVFSRSVDWCPYCQLQAIDLNDRYQEFEELGYRVAVVTYDSPDAALKFTKKHEIVYPILSDKGSVAIRNFGLLNKNVDPNSQQFGIPHPAIYVVANDGTIMNRFFEEGYKERPSLDDILAYLKRP